MTRPRSLSSESFLLQAYRRSTSNNNAPRPFAVTKQKKWGQSRSQPHPTAPGRITIPSTRRHAESRKQVRFNLPNPIEKKIQQSWVKSAPVRTILRKASGLLNQAREHQHLRRMHEQNERNAKSAKRSYRYARSPSGKITPPSVRNGSCPQTPSKRWDDREHTSSKSWDEREPNARMRHRYVCLSSRSKLVAGNFTSEQFKDAIRESGQQLNIMEPFGAEFFVDVCSVGENSPRVAGRAQLRRFRKHKNLLAAAAVQDVLRDNADVQLSSSEDESTFEEESDDDDEELEVLHEFLHLDIETSSCDESWD